MSNYPLRLPEHLMTEARGLAAANGTSLNQFLSSVIAERIGELKALRHVETRILRADPEAALAALVRMPERPPIARDEL